MIGAVYADKLSPHNLRHIRIAECGEDWDMDREEIKHVSAHEQGQHEQVYKDRDEKKLLSGAGQTPCVPMRGVGPRTQDSTTCI